MWPTIAADFGPPRSGLSAQASSDEGGSGRSAGSNTSLALKPTVFPPKAAAGKLFIAISFWPAVVGRVGEIQGTGRQGVLSSCGKRKAASCADLEAHLLFSASQNHATIILFYCCVLVFFFLSLGGARLKRRSEYATINKIEARLLSSSVLGLDNAAVRLEFPQWKLRSALPIICPPVKLCPSEAEMLPTTCFQNEERWPRAPRDAPPTPIEKQERQHQDLQGRSPHTPHTPIHHFVVPVLWQHGCAHGCSSCEYS